MWRMLRKLNLTFKKPERRYYQADPILRDNWLNNELPIILKTAKKYKTIFLHDKTITSKEVIYFLGQMLKYHKRRHVVVVIDNAPPHIAKRVKNFILQQKRLHVFYLPSYSPDFNPDEQVWNHLKNQELKGHQAKRVKEMKALVRKKLVNMSNNSKLLKWLFFKCYVANFMN